MHGQQNQSAGVGRDIEEGGLQPEHPVGQLRSDSDKQECGGIGFSQKLI